MGLEFEDDDEQIGATPRAIGRFDIAERTDERLRLVAQSRTQTYAMKWGRWPSAIVLLGLCAWGTTLNPAALPLMLGLGGVFFAVIVMMDFTRVATEGVFLTVEHSLEIERTSSKEGYREAGKAERILVDGLAMTSPIRDVRVLCESIPRSGGQEVCRVYLVFDERIVTLESTKSRVIAMRLASLVRGTCGLPADHRTDGESQTLGGCLWSGLFYVIACLLPMLGGPLAVFLPSSTQKIGYAAAMIFGLIALEYLFALPMRSAVRNHVRQNLRT